ncbi:MAG: AAA family ATPase [Succinivibrio sp.]|nr:AAA family ATPase [Succinivibrio sp.]
MITNTTLYSNLRDLIFSDIVDLTQSHRMLNLIRRLDDTPVHRNSNVFLLIRPRGFGLSLAVQTIAQILGRDVDEKSPKAESLAGLPACPVIRLDLKGLHDPTAKGLASGLIEKIQELYWKHHIEASISFYDTPKTLFTNLIFTLHHRHNQPIVVMIDNYDYPFIYVHQMPKSEQAAAISFYLDMLNVLKHSGPKVKWCLLTGHIKFALATEISEGLPFVVDISNEQALETLFGYTPEDVMNMYGPRIEQIAENLGLGPEQYLEMLEKCYGGFNFSDNLIPVMCPACIGRAISNQGKLYPYSADGEYGFLKDSLKDKGNDLDWLIGRDGQDPLFADCIDLFPQHKALGSLLIQLGFATRDKVTIYDHQGYATWRYRYKIPNEDMLRTFQIIDGQVDASLSILPIEFEVQDSSETVSSAEGEKQQETAAAPTSASAPDSADPEQSAEAVENDSKTADESAPEQGLEEPPAPL